MLTREEKERTRISDDIRIALNYGTTLTTRFWLSLIMIAYGGGFYLNEASWLASPSFADLTAVVTLRWWAIGFLITGSLGMWRVWAPTPLPLCAWVINTAVFAIWFSVVLLRIWDGGRWNYSSLASTYSILTLAAAWCLIRTEATYRDTETA